MRPGDLMTIAFTIGHETAPQVDGIVLEANNKLTKLMYTDKSGTHTQWFNNYNLVLLQVAEHNLRKPWPEEETRKDSYCPPENIPEFHKPFIYPERLKK